MAANGKSSIPESMRAAIVAAQDALEEGEHPASTDDIRRAVRHGVSRSNEKVCDPFEANRAERELLVHRGWVQVIGEVLRRTTTARGRRTLVSVPTATGRSYKQLTFVTLEDAMGVLQTYESGEQAYALQARGWRIIVARMTQLPEGAVLADVFRSEDLWDKFWDGIRATDLAA